MLLSFLSKYDPSNMAHPCSCYCTLQLADGNKKGNKLVLFPPADQRTQEIHLQTMMQDIAALLLMEFEKYVLRAESGGTILKTPLDPQASLSSEEVYILGVLMIE